jgi:tetratricopeptide (TPR) repeat protein
MPRTPLVPWMLALSAALSAQTGDIAARLESARRLRIGGAAPKALLAYESMLPELRASGPRPLLIQVLFEAAQSAITAGDYARAVPYAEESAKDAHEASDAASEGLAYNLMGQAHLYQADYARALPDFERAFQLADAVHNSDDASVRLGNIGNVHFFQGRYLDALGSYERALQKAEETSGAASNGRQLALANIAILYEQLGQNERALSYFQRARASAAALRPEEFAQLLSNMGTLYRRMGDPVKALAAYHEARQVFARAKHSDGEIHVLHNEGLVLALDYKAPDRALKAFTEAMKLADGSGNRRQSLLAHLYRGEALLRMDCEEDALTEYGVALQEADRLGAAEEKWAAQYGIGQSHARGGRPELARAAFGQAVTTIETLRGGLGGATLKAEFLGNKRNVYDAYIASVLDSGNPDRNLLFDLFEKARSRNLQDALRRRMAPAGIRAAQQRLDADSVLVEYWLGDHRMAALWITRDASGILSRPLTNADLDAARTLAQAFENGEDPAWRDAASKLGPLLLDGLPLAGTRRNLILVPDGILYSIPFDVLPAGGGRGMLVENFAISHLPAGGLLADRSPGRTPPWRRQLLGFGDPLPPQSDELSQTVRWERLPESARELNYIAREVSGRSRLHLGGDNLKRYLAEAAVAAPLLHFGTHAAVDFVDPSRSRILFTGEPGSSGSKYLFWQEVQQLQLAGVDLVTLAACDTEEGKLVPGEGIQNFSRAFMAAGARSTVTALWRVADRATAEFMRLFYADLARRVPKAEALRRAKVAMLRSHGGVESPRFWAAFVLTGDGRGPVPVWIWSDLAIAGGSLAVVVMALVWWRSRHAL